MEKIRKKSNNMDIAKKNICTFGSKFVAYQNNKKLRQTIKETVFLHTARLN